VYFVFDCVLGLLLLFDDFIPCVFPGFSGASVAAITTPYGVGDWIGFYFLMGGDFRVWYLSCDYNKQNFSNIRKSCNQKLEILRLKKKDILYSIWHVISITS
jgi:hypothetical protein